MDVGDHHLSGVERETRRLHSEQQSGRDSPRDRVESETGRHGDHACSQVGGVSGGCMPSSWATVGTSRENTGAAAVPPKRLIVPAGGSSMLMSTVICGSSAGKNPTKL